MTRAPAPAGPPRRQPWYRRLLGPGLVRRLPRRLRDQVVLRRLRIEPSALDGVTVKIAETPEEHDAAARLTFEAYAGRGLVDERGVPVRVTPFLMVPSTVTFVALVGGEVVGTLSLIVDSKLGLPLECIFEGEVRGLRARGLRLAEVGALAVKKEHRGSGLVLLLYKAMWLTASRLLGVHRLVVAVHPDAEPLYTSPLRFVALGRGVRRYPGLSDDALAVGLQLDLTALPQLYQRDFERLGPALFNPWRFFLQTRHAQLALPGDATTLAPCRRAHQQAALRLASLRPDMLAQLEPEEFHLLLELCEVRAA